MTEEEKGFIIKDRRSFDEEGELKDESGEIQEEKGPEPEEAPGKEAEGGEQTEGPPLPEVNFNSLIMSLSSSALVHLGEIADPNTGQTTKDLAVAKHSIDIIAMLKEKTEGNLTEEEQKFLDAILTDMRWRYVKAAE